MIVSNSDSVRIDFVALDECTIWHLSVFRVILFKNPVENLPAAWNIPSSNTDEVGVDSMLPAARSM